jgi:hypothetical protein
MTLGDLYKRDQGIRELPFLIQLVILDIESKKEMNNMLTVKYIHRCDYCGKEITQTYEIPEGSTMPKPCVPYAEGWTKVGSTLVCDEHAIEVKDKDGFVMPDLDKIGQGLRKVLDDGIAMLDKGIKGGASKATKEGFLNDVFKGIKETLDELKNGGE